MPEQFNIYFPKYYFVLSEKFDIEFDTKQDLPFEYYISKRGTCDIKEIKFSYHSNNTKWNQTEIRQWKDKKLQRGLTIMSINDRSIMVMSMHSMYDNGESGINYIKFKKQIDDMIKDIIDNKTKK